MQALSQPPDRTLAEQHGAFESSAPLMGCLVMISGPEAGRRFPFHERIVIGRGEDADLRLEVVSISRRHACVRQVKGNLFELEDLGSQNGTSLNGVPVRGRVSLAIGDRIQLGSRVTLRLTVIDPAEEERLRAHQLELIGRLSAGVAHDINNLLTVLMAATSGLRALPPDTTLDHDEVSACVRDIETATRRAAELTTRLTGLMRRDVAAHENLDLSELCREVLQLSRRTFPAQIAISPLITPGLRVHGDRMHLHQLLLNLCVNARDAMPHGGTLTLSCEVVSSPAATHSRPPPSSVLITIQDTGTGMDDATRARVFDPFFTTKARGSGTGLGLATVNKIAHDHGGRVEIASRVGQGTSVRVFLPLGASGDILQQSLRSQTLPIFGAAVSAASGVIEVPVQLTNVDMAPDAHEDDSKPLR